MFVDLPHSIVLGSFLILLDRIIAKNLQPRVLKDQNIKANYLLLQD